MKIIFKKWWKVQVTVEYTNNFPLCIDTILVSIQHQENIAIEELKNDIIKKVIKPTVDRDIIDYQTKFLINPTEKFTIGGAVADTGVTGGKIIADTYWGYLYHGGGAFSVKDVTKLTCIIIEKKLKVDIKEIFKYITN